ncbi:MAG TPA: hypothetical protein VLG50_08430 [Candidatus Saccharimonadales bacterium]|nr:hypothetical protein [Candidatus Saccharimonadales bacterium]
MSIVSCPGQSPVINTEEEEGGKITLSGTIDGDVQISAKGKNSKANASNMNVAAGGQVIICAGTDSDKMEKMMKKMLKDFIL